MRGTAVLVIVGLAASAAAAAFSDELAEPVRIEAGGKPIDTEIGHAAPFVCDFDGDGRPDLLVGDYCTLKPDRSDPTPEEQARYDQIQKELEPLEIRFGELIQKLRAADRPKTKEEQNKLYEDLNEISRKISPL